MIEVEVKKLQESLQDCLVQVVELLYCYKVVEDLIYCQEGQYYDWVENFVYWQNFVEFQCKLEELYFVDIVYIFELLLLDDCFMVWQLVKFEDDGDIFFEVFDVVWEILIVDMDDYEIIVVIKDLDVDEFVDLVLELLCDVVYELMESFDVQQCE